MTDLAMSGHAAVASPDGHFIGGAFVAPAGPGTLAVVDPTTEAVIARVPEGSPADVERAVAAAAAALPAWARTPPGERRAHLEAILSGLRARADQLAHLIACEVGSGLRFARSTQVGLPLTTLEVMVELLGDFPFEEPLGSSLLVREPVGVVAAITPWNFPLHQLVAKVAPALAAGCTVVAKPSEVAPLTAFALAEVVRAAGLPEGVLNLVSGTGKVVGEALATHPAVDCVSFTGSTGAGRRVAELAARTVKRVALELGGKSATLILEDADLTRAVPAGVKSAYLNSGQTCNALTRMLVPRSRQQEAVAIACETAATLTVGDPLAPATRLGPLVSAAQRARVTAHIERAAADGARCVLGGAGAPEGLGRGYFVRPTIFAEVTPGMAIAQEEVFGPVLAVIPYRDEADAVRIANDTIYGLAAAVWSQDPGRAEAVARRLRAGQVDCNGARFNPRAPFGGMKQSGLGRELGRYGLEAFQELKAIQR